MNPAPPQPAPAQPQPGPVTLDRSRRQSIVLYLQDVLAKKSVACFDSSDGGGDPDAARFIVEQGASRAQSVAAHSQGTFDVLVALEVLPATLPDVLRAAKRLLTKEGTLVVGGPSRDRPGAQIGVSYFEILDALEPQFDDVRIAGQAPFFGATLVEYGITDPEPIIDGRLVEKGERVEWYVAVAGKARARRNGYAVIQLPRAPDTHTHTQTESVSAKTVAPDPELTELRQRLSARERHVDELQRTSQLHAEEMARVTQVIEERDGYIRELEEERGELDAQRAQAEESARRAMESEAREREVRRALAAAEGQLVRLNMRQTAPESDSGRESTPVAAAAAMPSAETTERIALLEKENAQLKEREAEARAESWKALRGRSEAEATAAQVREDTVRKLKDARKLASVELMRAMEEATRKAVSLKEDLERSERERKALRAELGEIKEKLAAADAAPPPRAPEGTQVPVDAVAPPPQPTSVVVELTRTLDALKQELAEARAELERLRVNEAIVAAAQAEAQERQRVELTAELDRMRVALDRSSVALAHERARSERLLGDERRAMLERNEARAQAAAVEAARAMAGLQEERLRTAFEKEQERAQQAEGELAEKKSKIKKLKNALSDAETRATAAIRVSEQLGLVESALRGEEIRLGSLEEALRQPVSEHAILAE